jgi:hypothetical protein
MARRPILKLGHQIPTMSRSRDIYWIGADRLTSGIEHGDGLIVLGRDCSSLEDLERVATEIREDLDNVLQQARKKLAPT